VAGSQRHWQPPTYRAVTCTMSEYRDTISLYTDIAFDIVPDVVIRHRYIPTLRACFPLISALVLQHRRMARMVVLEQPNIQILHLSFDIKRKNYDVVPDIVPDSILSIPDHIVYINLTCHLEHAGPSLEHHGISDSNDDEDRQMDDDDLSDYEHQILEDFSLSQAKGPISKFLADMPGMMDSAFAIDAG
jgi:hypothetical protein